MKLGREDLEAIGGCDDVVLFAMAGLFKSCLSEESLREVKREIGRRQKPHPTTQ